MSLWITSYPEDFCCHTQFTQTQFVHEIKWLNPRQWQCFKSKKIPGSLEMVPDRVPGPQWGHEWCQLFVLHRLFLPFRRWLPLAFWLIFEEVNLVCQLSKVLWHGQLPETQSKINCWRNSLVLNKVFYFDFQWTVYIFIIHNVYNQVIYSNNWLTLQ